MHHDGGRCAPAFLPARDIDRDFDSIRGPDVADHDDPRPKELREVRLVAGGEDLAQRDITEGLAQRVVDQALAAMAREATAESAGERGEPPVLGRDGEGKTARHPIAVASEETDAQAALAQDREEWRMHHPGRAGARVDAERSDEERLRARRGESFGER